LGRIVSIQCVGWEGMLHERSMHSLLLAVSAVCELCGLCMRACGESEMGLHAAPVAAGAGSLDFW
jgi:hypothetical protein